MVAQTNMNAMFPWMMTPADVANYWSDFMRKSAAMPKILETMRRTRVGATATEVTFNVDKVKLHRYVTDTPHTKQTPLVFVFALVNRPYILDLRDGKSVVQHFTNAGFDTYNVDWGVPTHADRHLGMREYILRYLDEIVDHVREYSGQDKINILGYCMGGSMSAMYAALHPEKVKNLIMLAAPVDWSDRSHLLAKFSDKKYFDVDRLIEVYGNAPADMLQSSFLLLKPISNLVEKYITFYENMDNEKFLETFFAMETWLNDNIPVAGEMFRQFVKYCMQENRLIEGRLRIDDRPVDLKNISCPLMNLVAENDHLVPCGLSSPLNDVVSSKDKTLVRFPAGHIGMAVGSKANREMWPEVANWLSERD
ncbi:MAG: class III poly(R)-hydroxyalkanoic acid synthase subunit PhaC [Planctomycetota bacterium]|jgi:polyhydroxyalkanoate synthase